LNSKAKELLLQVLRYFEPWLKYIPLEIKSFYFLILNHNNTNMEAMRNCEMGPTLVQTNVGS